MPQHDALFLTGIYATSRHIPGVKFAGIIHPGLIGTAPSHELLALWNKREAELVNEEGTDAEKTLCKHLKTRPLALLPEAKGALLGKLGHFKDKMGKDPVWDKAASEGARTIPGRENGGNCDIKNLSRGCTVYFPVFVEGANVSDFFNVTSSTFDEHRLTGGYPNLLCTTCVAVDGRHAFFSG